jgi:hypothetical protein
MVRARRGASRIGCLLGALLLVTVVYFGVNIGEVFVRYYRFRDAMQQEARFAQTRDDETIQRHLQAFADSLDLPEAAGRVIVRRSANRIVISSNYTVTVELPLFVREFHFSPRVERSF